MRYNGPNPNLETESSQMDYAHAMGCSLLGIVPAYAVYYFLRAKRRAWIPPLGWWLSVAIGAVSFFYGMSHSTVPSTASRITAVGEAYDYVEREIHSGTHHDTIYGFRFEPENGEPIRIETKVSLLDTAHPLDFNGRTLRVVYLKDDSRVLKNEAIDITILSGTYAGFHDSLDARPIGAWLAIPAGAAFAGFGVMGLKSMKDDADVAAADDDDDAPST